MNRRDFLKKAGFAGAGSIALASVPGLGPSLLDALSSPASAAGAAHVRWDIVTLDFSATPVTGDAGGVASALAADGSEITLTGSGTFVAPASGGGSGAATGGGTWEARNAAGDIIGTGTYEATALVRWEKAPGTPPPIEILIEDRGDPSAGLAEISIEYSDGSAGVLTVSCHFVGTPDTVFEGTTASKGFVDYFDAVRPAAGVDANRTLFHVR